MLSNGVQPFTHNGWHFDFVEENDLISKIIISVPITFSRSYAVESADFADSRR
jgi:hypothetical protein